MISSGQIGLVALRQCANRHHVDQYALVLAAAGINSTVMPDGKRVTLFVADLDAMKANEELMAYDSENPTKRPKRRMLRTAVPRPEVALLYWAVLLFFFAVAGNNALSLNWNEVGAAKAGAIVDGEWWRVVTALFLHVSVAHLLANLAFGAVFLLLLVQITGAGVAWLSMIVGGAIGNTVNALVHSPDHASIGTSTAIFASLGLLVVLGQANRVDERPSFSLRYWAPLIGGLTLLVILGFGGGNTDITAHVFGFLAGIFVGWILARLNSDWLADRNLQWKCGSIATAIVTIAWLAAALS